MFFSSEARVVANSEAMASFAARKESRSRSSAAKARPCSCFAPVSSLAMISSRLTRSLRCSVTSASDFSKALRAAKFSAVNDSRPETNSSRCLRSASTSFASVVNCSRMRSRSVVRSAMAFSDACWLALDVAACEAVSAANSSVSFFFSSATWEWLACNSARAFW